MALRPPHGSQTASRLSDRLSDRHLGVWRAVRGGRQSAGNGFDLYMGPLIIVFRSSDSALFLPPSSLLPPSDGSGQVGPCRAVPCQAGQEPPSGRPPRPVWPLPAGSRDPAPPSIAPSGARGTGPAVPAGSDLGRTTRPGEARGGPGRGLAGSALGDFFGNCGGNGQASGEADHRGPQRAGRSSAARRLGHLPRDGQSESQPCPSS